MLQGVPEPRVGKNRMHLDIVVDDIEAEVERLQRSALTGSPKATSTSATRCGCGCRTPNTTSSACAPASSGDYLRTRADDPIRAVKVHAVTVSMVGEHRPHRVDCDLALFGRDGFDYGATDAGACEVVRRVLDRVAQCEHYRHRNEFDVAVAGLVQRPSHGLGIGLADMPGPLGTLSGIVP